MTNKLYGWVLVISVYNWDKPVDNSNTGLSLIMQSKIFKSETLVLHLLFVRNKFISLIIAYDK